MNNRTQLTGLLLGAGASFDFGMPLLKELSLELKCWLTPQKLRSLNEQWRSAGPEFDFSDAAIEKVASALALEEMHYENLLGYLQVESQRWSEAPQDYHGLFQRILGIVYFLLQERHIRNVGHIAGKIGFLDGIKTLVAQNHPLWIFSLNHDLIIECFAANAKIPLNCGFTKETILLPRRNRRGEFIGTLEAEILTEDVIKNEGLPYYNLGQQGINLLKIHGSLDIFSFTDGLDLLRVLPCGEGLNGVIAALNAVNHDLKYIEPRWPGGVITASNEIVYADELGEMQFLRRSILGGAYKFDSRHDQVVPRELLNYFESNLRYITNLVCIGYGFGDRHVNQILIEWLALNDDHRLTIVDPNIKEPPSDFLHLTQQVDLRNYDCTDYLDSLGGIRRSQLEKTSRHFAAWKRSRGQDADSGFQEFLKQERCQFIEQTVNWASKLPIRDGEIDLQDLGLTSEEFVEKRLAEIAVPAPEEFIAKFLEQQQFRCY